MAFAKLLGSDFWTRPLRKRERPFKKALNDLMIDYDIFRKKVHGISEMMNY